MLPRRRLALLALAAYAAGASAFLAPSTLGGARRSCMPATPSSSSSSSPLASPGSSGRRRASRVVVAMSSTKDEVDSGKPSMPFASAPLPIGAPSSAPPAAAPGGGGGRRKPDPEKPAAWLELEDETAPSAPIQLDGDLLRDGGVLKTIVRQGDGPLVTPGAEVVVKYEGRTADGLVLCRGEDFRFLQGDGTMIGGFETAVGSMRVGELAKVTVQPWYAYGSAGVAPVVGPDTPLEFDIEVLESSGNFLNPKSFRDIDPKKLRDVDSIAADYAQRSELRMRNEENLTNFEKAQKWFQSLYFFGFFEGETGERPPWYLTPTITFPIMFLACAAAFYILASGGGITIKREILPIEGPETLDFGVAILEQVFA